MTENVRFGPTDIIVPVFNQVGYTRALLDGIYRWTDTPFHIYLIDNGSTDETCRIGSHYDSNITVVHNEENRGWCCGVNQGIAMGRSPNVALLNNDVEVSEGWLANLLSFLHAHPRIGAVGPLNSNPNDWQCVDRVRARIVPQIPKFPNGDLHDRNRILRENFHRRGILIEGMLAFFCVVLKRSVVNAVGLLDEAFVGGGDDDDYCRRLRKSGYVLGLSLDTYVLHHSSATHRSLFDSKRLKELRSKNLARLRLKHPDCSFYQSFT
jgi:GT2 family glycosyltransferase